MASPDKYGPFAALILEKVGGKENVAAVTHCMTRLRFNIKDESRIELEGLKKIPGVIGVMQAGGLTQVIVGQSVGKVYTALCSEAGIQEEAAIDENLDAPKGKLTPRKVGSNILNYLAGSLTPLIPVVIAAAMFKTVQVVLGPDMLNLITPDSDLYMLLGFIYSAGFYFLPIYLGYTSAKKLGVTPVLGMMMGCVLIVPGFVSLAQAGTPFTVYGIPAALHDYSQSVLPVLLSVWILSYVEKLFKKIMPDSLTTIFTPFLTMVVMVPLSLCLLAPAGAFVGDYIGKGLTGLGNVAGFIAVAVIAALWEYIVMSGMHMVLIVTAITVIMQGGHESLVLPAGGCATFAAFGMALGAFFMTRDKKEKSLAMGYFVSGVIGGVTEPALYGIGFKYKRPFITMSIGAFVGGLYAGITGVGTYVMGASNILGILGFVGGGTANLVNGIIAFALAFVVAAVGTALLGRFGKGVTAAPDTGINI